MSTEMNLIKASYSSVVKSDSIRVGKRIGGSASYILDSNSLPVKHVDSANKLTESKAKIKCVVLQDFDIYGTGEILNLEYNLYMSCLDLGLVQKINKEYRLNKNKVRSKILAYSHLKRSKIFMAFYSISFPKGLPDSVIRKIHNTVLTRLRKSNSKFSYIWVAERQKNGTLHFHMLTNTFFNIRIINYMYAKAIDNQIKKDKNIDINYDYKKYNGVDVRRVASIDSLQKYMTKYVTKNNETFDGLCWNCDSSVSALVTHVYLDSEEFKTLEKKIIYITTIVKDGFFEGTNIEFDIYSYGSYRPKIIFQTLTMINQFIMKDFGL